jgi:hypothetical protein
MTELLLLAVASACWPLLLAVVIISLRAQHPVRLMASFLAAALLTTLTVGLLLVYSLRGTSATSGSRHWFGPVVQIVAGSLALLGAAFLVHRRSRPRRRPEDRAARPGWVERMLGRGAPLAFVVGVVLNIVPGFMPMVAMTNIAQMEKGVPATVALVLGFYLIMFAFVEVPLVGYVVAPQRTARLAARFNAWLGHNAPRLAIGALGLVGTYLVVRGITHLAG